MRNEIPEVRSRTMRAVRSRDTAPELKLRRALHAAGARYRLHRRDLPGTPDIVLPKRRLAIFVHGCFWHAHDCRAGKPPATRTEYWLPKLRANQARDARSRDALKDLGWRVEVVWECELRKPADIDAVRARLLD